MNIDFFTISKFLIITTAMMISHSQVMAEQNALTQKNAVIQVDTALHIYKNTTQDEDSSPSSPHPNIVTFSLPEPLDQSISKFINDNPIELMSTTDKAKVLATLSRCADLENLPYLLSSMGLEKDVTISPSEQLLNTCDGLKDEWIPAIIMSLFETAQEGDIPAILVLLKHLDRGDPFVRVRLEGAEFDQLEWSLDKSVDEFSWDVQKIAYESIPRGNLFYAEQAIWSLKSRGTSGALINSEDGLRQTEPDKASLIEALALQRALFAIGAEPIQRIRKAESERLLTKTELLDAERQTDALIAAWLKLPVIYKSDIDARSATEFFSLQDIE
ncbi:MAG: hypothetical protein AAGJ37_17415 [Pseudomonadota bacterium]